MSNPQQRPARNRRQLAANAPRRNPDLAWLIASVIGPVVTLTLPGLSGRAALAAVPRLRAVNAAFAYDYATPVSSELTDTGIALTYAGDIQGGTIFSLPAQDPGYRTSLGAFLSPAIIVLPRWSRTTVSTTLNAPIVTFNAAALGIVLTLPNGLPQASQRVVIAEDASAGTANIKNVAGDSLAEIGNGEAGVALYGPDGWSWLSLT